MKVYHGNNETHQLIGVCQTQTEAFDIINNHVKSDDKYASPYYRFVNVGGHLAIDYGKQDYFYYIDFKEVQ